MESGPSLGGIARRSCRDLADPDGAFLDAVVPALPRLRRVARLLAGSSDAADELVSEAITRALPRWRAGDVAEPVGYLRATLVNLSTKSWRRRSLGLRWDHRALDWLTSAAAGEPGVAERDAVLQALMRLAPRRRAVVVLRFYEDQSIEAIADLMGCAVGTVKSQLSRALEQLRAELGGPES